MTAFLRLEGICKSYGAKRVLNGFSGTFAPGRLVALVGPNGAGKTTLLRIAAGLQHPDSGRIEGKRALYYGGFDTLPLRGTIARFRHALNLTPEDDDRKMSRLSRGELQSVGLSAAIELGTEVLLLDEPWTALEPDLREELNSRLKFISNDRVIVASSHDLDEVARVADDVVFIRDGKSVWKSREELSDAAITRDELMRIYREIRTP